MNRKEAERFVDEHLGIGVRDAIMAIPPGTAPSKEEADHIANELAAYFERLADTSVKDLCRNKSRIDLLMEYLQLRAKCAALERELRELKVI